MTLPVVTAETMRLYKEESPADPQRLQSFLEQEATLLMGENPQLALFINSMVNGMEMVVDEGVSSLDYLTLSLLSLYGVLRKQS